MGNWLSFRTLEVPAAREAGSRRAGPRAPSERREKGCRMPIGPGTSGRPIGRRFGQWPARYPRPADPYLRSAERPALRYGSFRCAPVGNCLHPRERQDAPCGRRPSALLRRLRSAAARTELEWFPPGMRKGTPSCGVPWTAAALVVLGKQQGSGASVVLGDRPQLSLLGNAIRGQNAPA